MAALFAVMSVFSASAAVTINGKTYYGKYINTDGDFTACAVNLAYFDN